MNSIKNAIVTVTLLAVGYGAYVVLNNPPEGDFDQIASRQDADTTAQPIDELPTVIIEAMADSATPDPASPAVDSTDNPLPASEAPATLPQLAPAADPMLATNNSSGVVDNWAQAVAPHTLEVPPLGISPPTRLSVDNTSRFSDDVTNTRQLNEASTQATWPPTETEPPMDVSLGPLPSDDSPAVGSGPFEQAWQTTEQHVNENNLGQALATLSAWHNNQTLNQQQRARCLRLLDQLAGTVIYSRQHLIEPEYEVKAGETLIEIAIRYAVPRELLAKINGIVPPFALATGEMLKIVRGPFRAEVSMSSGQLTLFLGSYYAGRIPVRIGRDLPAQAKLYEIAEKRHGRSYFDRQMGREVMTGEASNRYGNHWVGLRGDQTTAGHSVGIHGRPSDATEGEIGSISLNPLDAEDVFSILSIGSRVHVRR